MLKRKIYITLGIALALGLSANAQVEKWQKGVVKQEFLYDQAPFPSCHSATIVETPTGLVASYFGGTKERNPDVEIYISRFVEGKWLAPVSVANGVQPDGKRLPTWNPVLYQIPGGDLILFYKIGPKPSEWWGLMKTSKDGGVTWSDATKLPDGYIGPVKNKPVLLSNGNLFAPSSREGDGWKIHFEVTKDNGKTWRTVGPLPENGIKAIQPSILQHGNGKLQILARTANRAIVESWSEDNGESWSPLTKTSLPNNNSGTDAVTMKDGRQVLVYNHVLPPGDLAKGPRTPLNVSVSRDGKNWSAALILEDSPISQYSYPAVIQTSDGMLHFIYTWRRQKIKHVVVDPSKLKLKKIENGVWPKLNGYAAPVITETKNEEP
ncbi:exo-alpha-sialidase [Pedobacter sp. MC2016-05]|uniref:sialidase family protein n=1 Tax=Pedobacter sp. MC2016-05 TaxID=2994474 RepID=UPI0022457363|nr:sialidase family protein [Pedobacter sp. MC2016-05]MCX2476643.1 exo-alpha-sialidase [Pedobacter sp. MC2016-05]